MASAVSEADQLLAENASLAAKIASLKMQLGVAEVFDKQEKTRAKHLFDLFDKDKNGHIDREEFGILAYECGGELNAISDDNINATFAAVNKSGSGKVTFDEFWEWLSQNKNTTTFEQKGSADVNMLRLRLQSKAWVKSLQRARDLTSQEEKKVAAPTPAPAPDNFEDEKMFNFHVAVGHMKDEEAKGGIILTSVENPTAAAKIREEVQCPEEVTAFAHIDIGMKDDADDMKMGELLGMLEVIFDSLPLQQTGFYHSHTIDVHEFEDGTKCLRITLFSAVNPMELLQQIAEQGMSAESRRALKGAVRGTIKALVPFSLDQFYNNKDLALTGDLLKFVFKVQIDVDKNVLGHVEELVARMGPAAGKLRQSLAQLKFVKNIDLSVLFGELQEFIDRVSEGVGPMESLKNFVTGIGQQGVGHMLDDLLRVAAVYGTQHRELYTICQETLTGINRVHLQFTDNVIDLEFKGLSFVQFLPELPPM